LSTPCGANNSNFIVYLSVLSSALASYCGFLFRLTVYLYVSKRLYALQSKVELEISEHALENFGFKHIKKMMRYAEDVSSISLKGTNSEYFSCTERRLEKIKNVISVLP